MANADETGEAPSWDQVLDAGGGPVSPRYRRFLQESDGRQPPNVTKFTPQRVALILEALRAGYPKSTAAEQAGISRRTLYNWLKRGREAARTAEEQGPSALGEEDRRYALFFIGARRQMAEFERDAIEEIKRQGFNGEWQALMTLLERTRPEQFGRRTRYEHTATTDGGEITIEFQIGDGRPEGNDRDPAGDDL